MTESIKPPPPPPGYPNHGRLADLVKEARKATAVVHEMDTACRQAGRAAIKAAIDAGCALQECKLIIGHGKWQNWLKTEMAEISPETACRWMRLANASCMIDLTTAQCLTEAYRLCGILRPEAPKAARAAGNNGASSLATAAVTPPTPPTQDFPDRVRGMAKFFGAFDPADLLASTEPDGRQALADEVDALVKVLRRIYEELTKP